jgi:hypothetical protein
MFLNDVTSHGICMFCQEKHEMKDMPKHLGLHLKTMEKQNVQNITTPFYHIRVESEVYFLDLLVRGTLPMKKIDHYLKRIWLDCCGHMSAFGHKNYRVLMKHLVEDVFEPRVKIYHDYDFGTTTRVFLRGIKKYDLLEKQDIILMSRNEPLGLKCDVCKRKIATQVCTVCDFELFCENCSEKHSETCSDFVDYAAMPVVNSPRMGECGYEGGEIDLDRDGN